MGQVEKPGIFFTNSYEEEKQELVPKWNKLGTSSKSGQVMNLFQIGTSFELVPNWTKFAKTQKIESN